MPEVVIQEWLGGINTYVAEKYMTPERRLLVEFLESERQARLTGGVALGDAEEASPALTSTASGAVAGTAAAPGIGTAVGAVAGFLAGLFGGDSDTTNADPNSLKIFGNFRCNRDHDTERVNALSRGDVSPQVSFLTGDMYEGKPDSMNLYGCPGPIEFPFPKAKYGLLFDSEMKNANAVFAIGTAHSGRCTGVKACTNYAQAAKGWLDANIPKILASHGIAKNFVGGQGSADKFKQLMKLLQAKGQKSQAEGELSMMAANFYQVDQASKTLSHEDQALMAALLNQRRQSVLDQMNAVQGGNYDQGTLNQIRGLNGETGKLQDILAQLNSPNPQNREAAVRAIQALEGGVGIGTVIGVGAGALALGAIIFALARRS